jgi:hypothetical protein
MSEASFRVMLFASVVMVTIIYFYYQTVVFKDVDPNFVWNRIFRGKVVPYSQTTEDQRWAFFFLSTVNLLICILVVVLFIHFLGLIKEME